MGKLYDVVHPESEYTDPTTGQQKTRWKNCGAIIRSASGKVALKLDSIPANPKPNQDGQGGIWFQCMEPRQQQPAQPVPQPASPPAAPAGEEPPIPF
jgi:hypothetical protein